MLASLRTSIRAKILAVFLGSTFLALLVAAAAMLAYEVTSYRDFLIRDLQTQADILARTTAPALSFDNPEDASEDLALLESRSSFEAAAIYKVDGGLLATYSRSGRKDGWPAIERLGEVQIEETSISLFHPVFQSGNRLGTIYLQATYDVRERAAAFLLILIGVMIVALVTAGLVSLAVLGSVTRPLQAVTRIARRVVDEHDFSHRAERSSSDEIGVLVDAFNTMLHEVGTRTKELEAANRTLQLESETRRRAEAELRERDRRKDEFLATLAHELRNPMAPMVNASSLLRSPKLDPSTSERALSILERQQAHLVRLIDDLLDVSRITSGKLVIRKETAGLGEIVRSAIETVEPRLTAESQKLVLSMPDEEIYVSADPERLSQVLSNLIHNAGKFSERGSTISLSVSADPETARIEIADRGAGIAPEALDSVFEMFSQGDAPAEKRHGGLGVGLALARQLVELHGGTIEAASEGPGRGATFTVRIPRAARPEHAAPSAESGDEQPVDRARVLIVDDNVDYAASLAQLLGTLGHDIRVANTGTEALAAAREFEPEVAILDIGLPDINGRDLAGRLKGMAGDRGLVLIAISGWGQTDDKQRSIEAGFSLHLVKPVSFETIQAALRELWPEASA